MQHVILGVVWPVAVSIFVLGISYVLGNFVLCRLKFAQQFDDLFNISISSVLGFGLLANVSVILSLFGLLNTVVVWVFGGLIALTGYKKFVYLARRAVFFLKSLTRRSFADRIFCFIIVCLFLFYLPAVFTPPYEQDAIAYHLPEVVQITEKGLMSLFGYGIWNGNMPILMETLYAFLYKMAGFTLINLVHYQMLLMLLAVVYSFVKKEFSKIGGLLTVIFIFLFHPLLVHSTNAYINAGTTAFELSAVLLFFLWIKYKERNFLLVSGAMYGLALATKYTPLYSLMIVIVLFVYYSLRSGISKRDFLVSCLYFIVPAFLMGGFWYVKNLVMLGNPFHPFIFNHGGLSDQAVSDNLFLVRYLTGRSVIVYQTIFNYFLLPFKLFWRPMFFSTLIAFFVFPLGFFVRKNKKMLRLVMLFAFTFVTVWFFFISTNVIYGLIGPVLLMLVAGIVISDFIELKCAKLVNHKIFKITVIMIMVLMVLILSVFIKAHSNNRIVQLKINELKYAVGIINKSEFYYNNKLGEIYEVSSYINKNFFNTSVVNSWDGFNLFLQNGNKYISLLDFEVDKSDIKWESVCAYLREKHVSYIFINSDLKKRVFDYELTKDKGFGGVAESWVKIADVEEVILHNSTVIFSKYNGRLYQVGSCNK